MAESIFDTLMKQKAPSEAGVLSSIQAVKQAPGRAEAALPSLIAQQGKEELQEGARTAQREGTIGEQQLVSAQTRAAQADTARSIALQRLADKNDKRIQSLNNAAISQASAESRQFVVDSTNRKYMNQQMLDQYAAEQLLDQESLQNYVQNKDIALQRKAQLMYTYSKQIEQIIKQGFLKSEGDLDQESREKLVRLQAAFEQKKADAIKAQQKSGVMKSVITGAFTAAGAAVGSVYGGPLGTQGGAVAGGALGSIAGAGASELLID